MFGVRAPVYDIALKMSCLVRGRPYIIDQAIEEVNQDNMTTVAVDLGKQGCLKVLMFDLSCMDHTHDATIMDIGWELQNCHYTGILHARLRIEELKITDC